MARQVKSLYERLGGYDVIAAFTADYITNLRNDPRFARFSGGRSADNKEKGLQLNVDYMCKVTGGSHYYMGRNMKTAHAGLGITAAEWEAQVEHLAAALDKNKIPEREKRELIALIRGMKREIVEK